MLEICGKTDEDISRVIAQADREADELANEGGSQRDVYMPPRIKHYLQVSKVSNYIIMLFLLQEYNHLYIYILFQKHPSKIHLKRTHEGLKMEILALENQVQEQEKCHMEQISTLENERRLHSRDQGCIRDQYETRIAEMGN